MKKILTVAVVALSLMACNQGKKDLTNTGDSVQNAEREDVALVDVVDFDSVTFHDHPKTEPSLTLDVCVELPAENDQFPVIKVLRSNILSDVLGEKYGKKSPAEAIKMYAEDSKKDFNSAQESYAELEPDADAADMPSWECTLKSTISKVTRNLMVVYSERYDYMGGPRSESAYDYYNYDVLTGKPLRLDDVVLCDKQSREKLKGMLKEKLDELEKDSVMYVGIVMWTDGGNFFLNSNFHVNGDKLVFMFNPGEVAANCYGPLDVELEYDEISPLLIPNTALSKELADQHKNAE